MGKSKGMEGRNERVPPFSNPKYVTGLMEVEEIKSCTRTFSLHNDLVCFYYLFI